jgi:hypothetical protein
LRTIHGTTARESVRTTRDDAAPGRHLASLGERRHLGLRGGAQRVGQR